MVAIVTDSTAYLSKREAQELSIRVVPVSYTVGGRLYQETYADYNGSFEAIIREDKHYGTTAQVRVAAFMSTFQELRSQGFEVLCITLSSRLSGTYSSAAIAARECGGDGIRIVDSLSIAGGMYFLIREAKAMAVAGMTLDQIAAQLLTLREKVNIAFSVDDISRARRGGRFRFVRQSMNTMLNRKPLFHFEDGGVVADMMARGKYEMVRLLAGKIPPSVSEVVVHHIDQRQIALAICNEIKKRSHGVQVETRPVGPVVALHLGLGAVGVAWMNL